MCATRRERVNETYIDEYEASHPNGRMFEIFACNSEGFASELQATIPDIISCLIYLT